MSRQSITDKSNPPKSPWFNGKYRVNEESSKLLQEAVFKDGGGGWIYTEKTVQYENAPYLYVNDRGRITWGNDEGSFERTGMPEKQPPQPVKEFKVGKWYKCLVNTFGFLEGRYYRLGKVQGNLWFDGTSSYVSRGCFDINSESDYDPNAKKELAKDVKESKLGTPRATLEAVNFVHDFKQNDFSITKEEVNMNVQTQRKTVDVQLFDDSKGLPVQDSLVAEFKGVVTEDDNNTTIREVIMNNDIKTVLTKHNAKRAKVTDLDILARTGNSVALQPVLLKQLRWNVIG